MSQLKPFSPSEVLATKISNIPDFVIDAVNELLIEKIDARGKRAIIKQDDVIDKLAGRMPMGLSRNDVFSNNWLDFEPLFRENGWKVEYDKPGYDESYDAHWVFTAN